MNIREKYISNDTGVAIVDFDNILGDFFDFNNKEALIHAINYILKITYENCGTSNYLIRLYSGWMTNNQYTQKASVILQTLGSEKFFPVVIDKKIIQGEIELVNSLNSIDSLVWGDTYVRRKGLPRLRIERETLNSYCSQEKPNCPAQLLEKFSKTRNKKCFVEGCDVINSEAFITGAQKMVDTMMTIDIVDYSSKQSVKKICVFSDDTDLLPPIMRAHLNSESSIIGFLKNVELIKRFEHLTEEYGLELKEIQI